ncbi:MAG TPA: hypothetical protein VFE58_07545 [Tepidisphaeraceae bacterium]|jgi:hypothetical protein|nr:hypothetical protein [Tepidisphaeraceae bacterium]
MHTSLLLYLPIVISVISFIVACASASISWRNYVTSRMPVLVFMRPKTGGWLVKNIGYGPALNIVVAEHDQREKWSKYLRIPPLAVGSEFELPSAWLYGVLGATYESCTRHYYSGHCTDHRSAHFKGNQLSEWDPPRNIAAYGD